MSYITHQRGTQELFENRMKSKNISEWILHLLFVVLLMGGTASQLSATVYTTEAYGTVDPCDNTTTPSTFKLDNGLSVGFHSSILIRPDGQAVSWGQNANSTSTTVGVPTPVTVSGSPYSGEAVEVDICGGKNKVAFFLRTTTTVAAGEGQIYGWGSATGLTAAAIATVTLPVGVSAADVIKMEASSLGLSLLVGGKIYIKNGVVTNAESYGDNSSAADANGWHKVQVSGGADLTGVTDFNYNGQASTAITPTAVYTWGINIYPGGGGAKATSAFATPMSLPVAVSTVKQVKVNYDTAGSSTYALLANDGLVWVLGDDIDGALLGLGGSGATTSWANVLKGDQTTGSHATLLSDIVYIDINDVTNEDATANFNGMGALDSSGTFFTWGKNSQGFLSNPTTGSGAELYTTPHLANYAATGKQGSIIFFDVGGHIAASFAAPGEFCYAGHYVSGSIGNDPDLNDPSSSLEQFTCGLAPSTNLIPACLTAVEDDFTGTAITDASGATVAGNVLTNDSINGGTADATNVTINFNTTVLSGLTIDTAGVVTVPASTTAGSYDINYSICEIASPLLSPPNCSEEVFITIAVKPTSGAVLTLKKIVDNTAGGSATIADFTLTFTGGGTNSGSGITGVAAVTNASVIADTYTLTETVVANYTSSLTCTGATDTDLTGSLLTLLDTEVVTCTFTNTYTVATGPTAPTVVSQTTNDSTPIITGTLDSVDTISVIVNGETYTEGDGNLTDNTDGTWTLTIPTANAIPDGTYDVNATVTDGTSNTASDVTTNELIIDTVAPTPTPIVTAQTTNDTTPTITGDGNSSATLTVTVDGVTYTEGDGNLTDVGDDTWTLTIPVALTTDTTYDVNATLTDDANNTSSDGTTGELIIDTSITTPTVTTQTTSDTTPTITGTADSSDTLTVTVNGVTYTEGDGNLTDSGSDTWTLTIPAANALPTDITYPVTATVIDAATNTASDATTNELILDSAAVLPACGDTVTQMTAEKWYSVSRPCGLVTNPTVAELFNAAPGLGVYGTNWGLWKLDGTNPGYTNSESHTLLASDALVMKSGVGYWMWSDTNVTWDPGAIATLADPTGSSWNVPTVDTNTTAELNITDPDVSAFYVVTPIADLKVGLIRDTQEVLLGNPFNKAITWENVYFSSDNGNTYKRADANTTSGIRHTAWITNQDHTGSAVYPYEPISTTVGFKHTIEANQAFWIEVNGGWAAHPSERLAIPLEN